MLRYGRYNVLSRQPDCSPRQLYRLSTFKLTRN